MYRYYRARAPTLLEHPSAPNCLTRADVVVGDWSHVLNFFIKILGLPLRGLKRGLGNLRDLKNFFCAKFCGFYIEVL